jgi:hypothetical protein
MREMQSIAAVATAIISFAAAFHFHWAFGGRRGFAVSLPQRPDGEPVLRHLLHLWRPAALLVALGLVVLGALVAAKAVPLDHGLDPRLLDLLLLGAGIAFVARSIVPNRYVGFFKRLRSTRWARYDTRLYSPLFLMLGLCLILVARS